MPYTLTAGLAWFTTAFVIGVLVGVLIRSVAARRQVARARASDDDLVELGRLRHRVADLETLVASHDAPDGEPTPDTSAGGDSRDVAAATEVLGCEVALDDLTVIEGLGTGVEELCHGIGIRTWSDLAATEVSLLRTMLRDAGPRYQVHDPSTWPTQARLLAEGRWAEFRDAAAASRNRPST